MGLFSKSIKKEIPWIELTSEELLIESLDSKDLTLFFFKHSTRCSISELAKNRFEREWEEPNQPFKLFYLDLLNYRNISNKIAELTNIEHQSPQLIVWKNGEVIYNNSHNAIQVKESLNALNL